MRLRRAAVLGFSAWFFLVCAPVDSAGFRRIDKPARAEEETAPVKRSPGPGWKEPDRKADPSVEIYGTGWCPHTVRARNFFRSRGIDAKYYDIEKDDDALRRIRAVAGKASVPTVVIDGKVMHGFSQAACERALGNR